ncbi:MAG: AAA family ATPase [Falsiruegeria mediterranea]
MRFVERDRVAPPKWFAMEEARNNRFMLVDYFGMDEKSLSQTRSFEPVEFSDTSDPDRREVALTLAELFDGRCAFCESDLRDNPYVIRFRPISSATPVTDTSTAHLYYAWLAEAWQNLYPICADCRPGDPFHFPVTSNRRAPLPQHEDLVAFAERDDGRWPSFPLDENPVLVDPCYDRKLWRHFRLFPHGLLDGRDRRGRETIEHFDLNRADLQAAREATFEWGTERVKEYLTNANDTAPTALLDPGRLPHFGGWRIALRELLGNALGRARPSDNLGRELNRLKDLPDAMDRFNDAIGQLSAAEHQWYVDDAINPEEQLRAGMGIRDRTYDLPSKVEIHNYKSLEKIEVSLPDPPKDKPRAAPSLLILGENAAGKSTILEAMALALMDPGTRRALRGLDPNKMVLDPKYLGGDADPLELAQVLVSYGDTDDKTLTIRRAQDNALAGFQDDGIKNALPVFAYGAFRQYLTSERRHVRHRHVRSLFEPDELLSNPEKWLVRLSNDDFEMVARALRDVFSIEGGFDVLERDEKEVYIVGAIGSQPDGPKTRTPLSLVSSGFRSVLAMLCDVMHGLMNKKINPSFQTLDTARGLVLIDEIEAHLHPRWKVSIMSGLRSALPGVCFIATSHDPLCLRGMGKDEVLVLERVREVSEQGLPVHTQTLVNLPDNKDWTIQQLLTADFFQLQSTESGEARKAQAEVEDKLARGVRPEDDQAVRDYLSEMSAALPIGDTEVHRLVQQAIAEFLARRRTATQNRLRDLRDETKKRILAALEGV